MHPHLNSLRVRLTMQSQHNLYTLEFLQVFYNLKMK